MQSILSLKGDKSEVFASVEKYLTDYGFKIAAKDFGRPWGGFFVLDESQAQKFGQLYFPNVEFSTLRISGKLSPKILMVQANKRLSWQYHHRRAEIWKLVAGTAGVVTSETDQEGPLQTLNIGGIICLKNGQRQRLVGLAGWGRIATIWQAHDRA